MELARLELVDETGSGTQRVAVLWEPGRIGLARARVPEPGRGQIRVRVCWVGLCGSDVEAFLGRREPEFAAMPMRLGHEVAGLVDAISPEGSEVAVGDTVATRYVWGALAEYIVCRPFNVIVLPKDFSLIDASLIEIMPRVLHAVDIGQIDASKKVLIMGQGVSGLVMTQVVRRHGPKALDFFKIHRKRLDLFSTEPKQDVDMRRYFAEGTRLVTEGAINTSDLVTHNVPLSQIAKAFDLKKEPSGDVIHVMVDCES